MGQSDPSEHFTIQGTVQKDLRLGQPAQTFLLMLKIESYKEITIERIEDVFALRPWSLRGFTGPYASYVKTSTRNDRSYLGAMLKILHWGL